MSPSIGYSLPVTLERHAAAVKMVITAAIIGCRLARRLSQESQRYREDRVGAECATSEVVQQTLPAHPSASRIGTITSDEDLDPPVPSYLEGITLKRVHDGQVTEEDDDAPRSSDGADT